MTETFLGVSQILRRFHFLDFVTCAILKSRCIIAVVVMYMIVMTTNNCSREVCVCKICNKESDLKLAEDVYYHDGKDYFG